MFVRAARLLPGRKPGDGCPPAAPLAVASAGAGVGPPGPSLARRAYEQRLVRIYAVETREKRKLYHIASLLRVQMRSTDQGARFPTHAVVDLPALSADLQSTAATRAVIASRHHDLNRPILRQVDRREPFRRGDQELVPLGGVCVLVEIETRAARLLRKPHHPVPGIRIDPLSRQFRKKRCGERALRKKEEKKSRSARHKAAALQPAVRPFKHLAPLIVCGKSHSLAGSRLSERERATS